MENGVVCVEDLRGGGEFGGVPVLMGGEDGGFCGTINTNYVRFAGFGLGPGLLSRGKDKEEKEEWWEEVIQFRHWWRESGEVRSGKCGVRSVKWEC